MCCLPKCAQGSSAAVTRVVGYGAFWAFWVLLGVLCIWEVLLVFLSTSTGLGLRRCGYRWTRPLGGGGSDSFKAMLYVLALAGLPSLHGYYACVVLWVKGIFWRNCRQKICENSFSPGQVFCLVGTLLFGGGVRFSGIFGLVGPGIQAHSQVVWLLRCSTLEGGSLLVIWFWRLWLTLLLLLSAG